jgi:hypothetical protein
MLEQGPAGAGAREVHARLQQARLRSLREAGCGEEELAAAIEDAPAHERAWLVGADGEERVGRVLEEWATAAGFALLIDVTPPGQTSNLDFIAVARRGVVVIDAKAWTGGLRFADDSVWIGRYGKRKDLEALGRQVEQVGAVLDARGLRPPVEGLLCMANENDGLPAHGLVEVGGAAVGTPDAVGRALAAGGPLSDVEIDHAVTALCEAFALRGLVPRVEPAPRAAVLSAPRRRVGRRRLARVGRWAMGTMLGRAVALLAIGAVAVAIDGPPSGPPATADARALDAHDLRSALPDLRRAARAAAGGKVHGPAVATTGAQFRLTFRRGRCRVLVHVDRSERSVLAGATLTAGRSCAPRRSR